MSKKKTEELEQLQIRVDELEAQLKRAVADYHNLEKRVAEGRSELTRWGTNELLAKILPVLDHLEQALAGANETDRQSGWFRGVELAVKQLYQVLQSEGLEEIQAEGEFNPASHEAVDVREVPPSLDSSGEPEDNIILEVVRKGYTLNGKILRPAAVVVGRRNVTLGSEATPESADSGQARMTEDEKGEMSS